MNHKLQVLIINKKKKKFSIFERPGHFTSESGFTQRRQDKWSCPYIDSIRSWNTVSQSPFELFYFDNAVEGESILNSLYWTITIFFFLIWTHWFKSLTTHSLLLNCNTVGFNRVLHFVLLHYYLEGNDVLCSALLLINSCSYCFYNSRVWILWSYKIWCNID